MKIVPSFSLIFYFGALMSMQMQLALAAEKPPQHIDFASLPLDKLGVLVDGNVPYSLVEMANRYLAGQGVESSFRKAITLLVDAADEQNTKAMHMLYRILREGDGQESVAPNEEAAVEWLKRGATLGDFECIRDLERRRDEANAIFPSDSEIIRWLESGVKAGRPDSMVMLSIRYLHGVSGVEENIAQAEALEKRRIDILLSEAAQGSYDAMLQLSRSSQQDALHQWSKAMSPILEARAAVGNSTAMADLANYAKHGYGREKSKEDESKWVGHRLASLEEGCKNKSVQAMRELGMLYLWGSGSGVPVDTEKGLRFLTMAAEVGDEFGTLHLCDSLQMAGEPKRAFEWLSRAAVNGSSFAMTRLALAYEKGTFGPRDYVAAYCWHSLSREARSGDAELLNKLEQKMTTGQIAEAQALTETLRTRVKWQKKEGTSAPPKKSGSSA